MYTCMNERLRGGITVSSYPGSPSPFLTSIRTRANNCTQKIEGEGEPGKEPRLPTAIPAVVTLNFFLPTAGMAVGGRGSLPGSPSPSIFHVQLFARVRIEVRKGEGEHGYEASITVVCNVLAMLAVRATGACAERKVQFDSLVYKPCVWPY